MSDLFGSPYAAPPAAAKRQLRPAGHAGLAQNCRPATEQQVAQAEPPAPAPAAPRGRLMTLHDGRQVDSWSEEWRLETLARTLLQLGGADQDEWIRGYSTPEAQTELRLRMGAIRAAGRRRP